MDIACRRATQDDIVALTRQVAALNAFHDDFSPVIEQNYLDHWHRFDSYIAETPAGDIIAFAAGHEWLNLSKAVVLFDIQLLNVDPLYSRQGIGRKLMHFLIRDKYAAGVHHFYVHHQAWNNAAGDFYVALGFVDNPRSPYKRLLLAGENLKALIERKSEF